MIFSLNAMTTDKQLLELVPHTGRYFVRVLVRDASIYVEDENATHCIPITQQNILLRQILRRSGTGKFLDGTYVRVDKTSRGKYFLSAKESEEK